MKKYISLIGALALGSTTSLTVVACGANTNDATPVPNPGTENIKLWSNQTSNIAKSLILSKNENFNTNRVLNNALNSTENNILKNTDPNTGSSYINFKNTWGYKSNIEGITEADFNNDHVATIDNNQLKTKEEISSTISQIQEPLNTIAMLPPALILPSLVFSFLDGAKASLATTLWGLKENPEIINMVKSLLPSITSVINSFDAFNPETVLGEDYNEDITKALFGDGQEKKGWLANYEAVPGFKSEAVKKKSSILKESYFQDWNQVALFKSSIDLNALVYQMSNNTKSLGDMFNDAIKYSGNKVTDFDLEQFFTDFQATWSSSPENIISLISNLIPIVKYQLLGVNPTKPVTKLTTKEDTNPETGIININNVLTKVEEILLTKEGFTDFISKIFFANSETDFSLANYFTFDFTVQNNQTLSSALFSIKDKLTPKLDTVYTDLLEPVLKNAFIQDILNKIKEDLAGLTTKTGFEFELTQFQQILKVVDGIWPFLDKIASYENKDQLISDWDSLWATLGLVRGQNSFTENSVLDQLKKFLGANTNFLPNLSNLLKAVTTMTSDSFDVLIEKETTAKIDFNNENLWSIDESTVKFSYNASLDETTIYYNLTDESVKKTYSVTVVVKGNADTPLIDAKQVWLKALNSIS